MNVKLLLLYPFIAVIVLAFAYSAFNTVVAVFYSWSAIEDMEIKYKKRYGFKTRTSLCLSAHEVELNFSEGTAEYGRAMRVLRYKKRANRGFFVYVVTILIMIILQVVVTNT